MNGVSGDTMTDHPYLLQPIPRGTAPYWGTRRKSLRAQPASPPTGPTAQTARGHPAARSTCRDHRRSNRGPGCAVCLVARWGEADLYGEVAAILKPLG